MDGEITEVDAWTHLAISFDSASSNKAIFINGQLFAEDDAQLYVQNTTQDLHIGSGSQLGDTFRFLGDIDDAGLFDTALSEAEISNIMKNGLASLVSPSGDFDRDGMLDIDDINRLVQESASGMNKPEFDVTNDGKVNQSDVQKWAKDLKRTWIGDVNLDREFSSTELVQIFQAGKFELDVPAVWSEGDWTGDARFNSSDLVAAFQDGGFEIGPRPAQSVPEPGSTLGMCLALFLVNSRRRNLRAK